MVTFNFTPENKVPSHSQISVLMLDFAGTHLAQHSAINFKMCKNNTIYKGNMTVPSALTIYCGNPKLRIYNRSSA